MSPRRKFDDSERVGNDQHEFVPAGDDGKKTSFEEGVREREMDFRDLENN